MFMGFYSNAVCSAVFLSVDSESVTGLPSYKHGFSFPIRCVPSKNCKNSFRRGYQDG